MYNTGDGSADHFHLQKASKGVKIKIENFPPSTFEVRKSNNNWNSQLDLW